MRGFKIAHFKFVSNSAEKLHCRNLLFETLRVTAVTFDACIWLHVGLLGGTLDKPLLPVDFSGV